MKLIIGLGNPGKDYKNTRHNLGFLVVDSLLEKLQIQIDKKKFNGEFEILKHNDEKIIIAKPLTFMNLSGNFVRKISDYFKIEPKDILIIHDDKNIEVGKFKIAHKGSSGGQNGIKDIINKIGTENFNRIRVGIGFVHKNEDTEKYVLSNFNAKQIKIINNVIPIVVDATIDFIKTDISQVENNYNDN